MSERRRAIDAQRFEPLEQRRQRAGVEEQLLAEPADRHAVFVPQRQHHQILRVGEAEPLQRLAVDAVEGKPRRMDREAEEIVECDGAEGWNRCVGSCRKNISCTIISQA